MTLAFFAIFCLCAWNIFNWSHYMGVYGLAWTPTFIFETIWTPGPNFESKGPLAPNFKIAIFQLNLTIWVSIRQFVIFKDVANHGSPGQKYPTDQYTKRIQQRNDYRSCRGSSRSIFRLHARNTCICSILCFLHKNQCNLNKFIYCFLCFPCYFIA